MSRKILIFALIFACFLGFEAAFANPPTQIDTSNQNLMRQQALVVFEAGKAAHDGINTPQDFQKARLLYLEAADLGSTRALINLGYIYFTGQGVKQDMVKAREFYELAARRGNADAKANLRMMDARGLGLSSAAKPDVVASRPQPPQQITAPKSPVIKKPTARTVETLVGPGAALTPQVRPSAVSVTAVPAPIEDAASAATTPQVSQPQTDVTLPGSTAPETNKSDLGAETPEAETQVVNADISAPVVLQKTGQTPGAAVQRLSSRFDRTDIIAALMIGFGAFLILIYYLILRKQNQNRSIRERFVQFFYEAKRSDLRLTYLRRRSEGFVQETYYQEWHATLTVLMARYALTFDEPDAALRAFCKKLNEGLSLHMRPTQHLASEFSDQVMQAARSEVKAIGAFHTAKITKKSSGPALDKIWESSQPQFRRNVVNLFRRRNA